MVTAGKDNDYIETLKKTFGLRGWYFGMLLYIIVLSIPITIFYILLAQFLYPTLLVIFNIVKDVNDFSIQFNDGLSYSYTCLIIFGLLWLLTIKRNMAIFVKLNTIGVIFTIIIVIFIVSNGIYALSTSKYEYVVY